MRSASAPMNGAHTVAASAYAIELAAIASGPAPSSVKRRANSGRMITKLVICNAMQPARQTIICSAVGPLGFAVGCELRDMICWFIALLSFLELYTQHRLRRGPRPSPLGELHPGRWNSLLCCCGRSCLVFLVAYCPQCRPRGGRLSPPDVVVPQ